MSGDVSRDVQAVAEDPREEKAQEGIGCWQRFRPASQYGPAAGWKPWRCLKAPRMPWSP